MTKADLETIIFMPAEHSTRRCVDLRRTFGRRFRYEWDPAYHASTPKGRKSEQAWLTRIECKHGWIAPHGGRRLAAYCDAGPVKRRELEGLTCVGTVQGGGDCPEVIVTFDVADIEQIATVLKARRPRVYTSSERARRRSRLSKARALRKRSKSLDTDRLVGGQERQTVPRSAQRSSRSQSRQNRGEKSPLGEGDERQN